MNSQWEVGDTGFVERDYEVHGSSSSAEELERRPSSEKQFSQDQDFKSILIQALNEGLKSARPQWRLQTPIMYWTHADCGILLELAKVSPGIVDHLPKYQVASNDPAATEDFYSALRQAATVAQGNMRRKRLGYQHVQLDSFSSSWGHLPWQFSGFASRYRIAENDRHYYSPQQHHQHHQLFNWSLAYHQYHQRRHNENSYFPRSSQQSGYNTELFSQPDKPSFSQVAGSRYSGNEAAELEPHPSSVEQTRSNQMPNCAGFAFRSEDYLASLKSQNDFMSSQNPSTSSSLYFSSRPGKGIRGFEKAESTESNWMPSTLDATGNTRLSEDFDQNVTSTDFERCGQGRYWPSTHNSNPEEYGSSGSVDVEKGGAGTFGIGYFRSSKSFGASKHSYHCREEDGGVKGKESKSKPKYHCVFCKGNDEDEAIYSSHPMKINNIVFCPSLRNYICQICQATGDNAHTIKYCPQNKRGFFATRSHEKCNSRNRSRTKMKVLSIEALGGSDNEEERQQFQKIPRPTSSKFGSHAGDEGGTSDHDEFGESDEYEC